MRLGDTVEKEFKDMTAEEQAAWLAGQSAATGISTGVDFKDMTADQQTAFLNLGDFNHLTIPQQTALLNTLSTGGQWIPGISNNMVIAGGAGLIVLAVLMGGRR